MNKPSIYKHPRIDPYLWHITILWIIEQVEAMDFDKPFTGNVEAFEAKGRCFADEEVYQMWQRPLYPFVESEVEA